MCCEKLRECHGIALAKETVRRWMREAGLWIARKQRPPTLHQPRNRRSCLGELIQIDGSDHRWFEQRAPACTLLVFIDDATSRLMTLHFTATESTFSYFEAMHKYLEQHGKPLALYSDKAAVVPLQRPRRGRRQRRHAVRTGLVRAQHRHLVPPIAARPRAASSGPT
jgi:hypothetical protein